MFNYNKFKIEATLEEEEVGCRRDHEANKEEYMDHPCMISSPLPLGGVIHNPPRVVEIFH
jgi:hypothetical protein